MNLIIAMLIVSSPCLSVKTDSAGTWCEIKEGAWTLQAKDESASHKDFRNNMKSTAEQEEAEAARQAAAKKALDCFKAQQAVEAGAMTQAQAEVICE